MNLDVDMCLSSDRVVVREYYPLKQNHHTAVVSTDIHVPQLSLDKGSTQWPFKCTGVCFNWQLVMTFESMLFIFAHYVLISKVKAEVISYWQITSSWQTNVSSGHYDSSLQIMRINFLNSSITHWYSRLLKPPKVREFIIILYIVGGKQLFD